MYSCHKQRLAPLDDIIFLVIIHGESMIDVAQSMLDGQ